MSLKGKTSLLGLKISRPLTRWMFASTIRHCWDISWFSMTPSGSGMRPWKFSALTITNDEIKCTYPWKWGKSRAVTTTDNGKSVHWKAVHLLLQIHLPLQMINIQCTYYNNWCKFSALIPTNDWNSVHLSVPIDSD